jgi:8-oxo-dGTP diphosphatase
LTKKSDSANRFRPEVTTTMPPPYCYDYPRPAVTVDLAVFALLGGDLRVLLIRRKHEPFAGRWALPGGFVEIDEPIEAAARRELREETGLDVTGPVAMVGVYGDPGRDPRGRTISFAHGAAVRGVPDDLAGADDAAEAAWLDPASCRGLAFDHDAILTAARDWLANGVAEGPLGLALLPLDFDDDDARALFHALGTPPRSAVAWRLRMLRTGRIKESEPDANRFRSAAD